MAKPWEKYQQEQTPQGKPWEKYSAPAASAAPAPAAPMGATPDKASWLEIVRQAPGRAAAGVAEGVLQTPENLMNIAKMAYGTGVTAAGYPGMAPSVEAPPQRVIPVLEQLGILSPLGEMTPAQKVANVGMQSGLAGLVSPATGAREMLSTGLKSALGGAAGETVSQATGNELLGLATTLATPGMATRAGQARLGAMEAAQPKLNALAEARAAGYKVIPSDVEPTLGRRAVESVTSREALEHSLATKNQKVTDQLAKQALGLNKNAALDEKVLSDLRKTAYDTGYKPLEQAGRINADVNYMLELNDVARKYAAATSSFPQAVKDKVKQIVDSHRENSFNSKDALKRISDLRADATSAFKRDENDLALAMRGVADALENQMERHLASTNPDAIDKFKQARIQIAKTHAVEDALKRGGGSVDATKLASAYERGAPLTGELETIAKTANTFGNVFRQPGKAKPLGPNALASAGLGVTTGMLSGSPLAGMMGAIAPSLAGGLSRGYIASPLGQRAIMPGVKNVLATAAGQPITDPLVLNALLASTAAANRSNQ